MTNEQKVKIICGEICDFHEISHDAIHKKTRKLEIVRPRQEAHYFAKELIKLSYREIGEMIGSKSHDTVMNSCKVITNLSEAYKSYADYIEEMRDLLYKELNKPLTIQEMIDLQKGIVCYDVYVDNIRIKKAINDIKLKELAVTNPKHDFIVKIFEGGINTQETNIKTIYDYD